MTVWTSGGIEQVVRCRTPQDDRLGVKPIMTPLTRAAEQPRSRVGSCRLSVAPLTGGLPAWEFPPPPLRRLAPQRSEMGEIGADALGQRNPNPAEYP